VSAAASTVSSSRRVVWSRIRHVRSAALFLVKKSYCALLSAFLIQRWVLPLMAANAFPRLSFTFKVAARCNLNCSYCYMYNKGDELWRTRPKIMSDEVFEAAVERIRTHCIASGQSTVNIAFHGGEPSLVGAAQFSDWCETLRRRLGDLARVRLSIQTNGTLLDAHWVDALLKHDVTVGVSIDGPKGIHDAARVDHQGAGSYESVARGLHLLQTSGVQTEALTVLPFGVDGLDLHLHLRSLGLRHISYLLPDFTHDTVAAVKQQYGPTPCADFLLPILNYWWLNEASDVKVGIFWHAARLIFGGQSGVDYFGSRPLRFMFIETDGGIEGLDVLRVCAEGMSGTGLNVMSSDFAEVARVSPFHQDVIFEGVAPPAPCIGCPEENTCRGGYLPHRYSLANSFDNRSIWCADILLLFGRFRELLNVSPAETAARRLTLESATTSPERAP
jgi:uncharacterized protein